MFIAQDSDKHKDTISRYLGRFQRMRNDCRPPDRFDLRYQHLHDLCVAETNEFCDTIKGLVC